MRLAVRAGNSPPDASDNFAALSARLQPVAGLPEAAWQPGSEAVARRRLATLALEFVRPHPPKTMQ